MSSSSPVIEQRAVAGEGDDVALRAGELGADRGRHRVAHARVVDRRQEAARPRRGAGAPWRGRCRCRCRWCRWRPARRRSAGRRRAPPGRPGWRRRASAPLGAHRRVAGGDLALQTASRGRARGAGRAARRGTAPASASIASLGRVVAVRAPRGRCRRGSGSPAARSRSCRSPPRRSGSRSRAGRRSGRRRRGANGGRRSAEAVPQEQRMVLGEHALAGDRRRHRRARAARPAAPAARPRRGARGRRRAPGASPRRAAPPPRRAGPRLACGTAGGASAKLDVADLVRGACRSWPGSRPPPVPACPARASAKARRRTSGRSRRRRSARNAALVTGASSASWSMSWSWYAFPVSLRMPQVSTTHRHRVHERLGDAGQRVGHARARHHVDDADAARRARHAVGHERRRPARR